MNQAPSRIYIVSPWPRWQAALAAGEFTTPALESEGFIHAATRAQLPGVLARHFDGQADLLLLEIDPSLLGDALRYDASARDGELFPHIYGAVPIAAVLSVASVNDRH